MRHLFAALTAACTVGPVAPALAQDQTPAPDQPTAVMRAEDAQLSCASIGQEAARLSEAMGGAPEGGMIRTAVGAVRAGATTLIPGAGLLVAGAQALTREDRERKEAADRAVAYRWYYLNGLSLGQGCQEERAEDADHEPSRPRVTPIEH